MALLSPGVETKEINLASAIGRAATGTGAMVGKFEWGPAYQLTQVTSESDVVSIFGRPNDYTAASFLTATNFLRYANDLRVVRICDEGTAKNASIVYNTINYDSITGTGGFAVGEELTITLGGSDAITEKGKVLEVDGSGNPMRLWLPSAEIIADAQAEGTFPSTRSIGVENATSQTAQLVTPVIVQDANIYFPNRDLAFGAMTAIDDSGIAPTFGDESDKFDYPRIVAQYVGEFGDGVSVEVINYDDYQAAFTFSADAGWTRGEIDLPVYPDGGIRTLNLASTFQFGPENANQYAVVVRVGGEVLETHIVSTSPSDRDVNGQTIFIDEYFENGGSQYIFAISQGWITASGAYNFGGGVDNAAQAGDWMLGYDMLSDPELLTVNLVVVGNAAAETVAIASEVQKYAVTSIGAIRQDCVVFCSPPAAHVVNKTATDAVDNIVGWRTGIDPTDGQAVNDNLNVSSTYAVIDGNYKYMYDKYSDRNRWVPLAGDIAGLCAFTDQVGQPWMSPAGFNRGQIAGVSRLAIDLRRAHRDRLYELGINPVVGFSGQGFVLYGDKTATTQASAFDRINVRRLFNMLKKAISDSAKYKLFELNNAFTRSSFKSEIDSYLTNIQDLGGIYDFMVVCDESNNPGSIVDRNEFVASIYIKPARSINFITLNFVATATDADFSELV
ncbi:tail sheath [Vibrio phage D479]